MKNTTIRHKSDVGDILTAIENVQMDIDDALEELRGIEELTDTAGALQYIMADLECLKDEYEGYMSGEYHAQIAEQTRDYYRSVL